MTRQRTLRRRESIYERNRRLERRKALHFYMDVAAGVVALSIGLAGLYALVLLGHGLGLS